MRTENSIKNMGVGLGGQLISSIMSFASRSVFIYTLSSEYLGISGLFSNILMMLSLAELGIGNAIIYSMYKPIADGNEIFLTQLLSFFGKVYRIIGIIVGSVGLLLTPFLGFFIKDMPDIPYFRVIYILYLLNTVVSYFYSYKCAVLDANQKQYIGNIYRYKYMIFRDIVQMAVLTITHNYMLYLIIQVGCSVYTNWKISKKAEELYPWTRNVKAAKGLNKETKKEIRKNVFAMFNHNVGSVVVNGTDNILISKFAGLLDVGIYSNYSLIINGIVAIVSKVTESVAASIGNLGVLENENKVFLVYRNMNFVNFWIYSFCSICFWVEFQPFITMWLGTDFLLTESVLLLICLNFYISGMRRVNITFRDSMGLFWHDRYKPLAEATINLVSSIYLGKRLGIAGVFIGTFLSNMLTGFWVEPYILYKHKFHRTLTGYMLHYFIYTSCMIIAGSVVTFICLQTQMSGWTGIVLRFIYCLIVINVIYLIFFWKTREFVYLRQCVLPTVKHILKTRG